MRKVLLIMCSLLAVACGGADPTVEVFKSLGSAQCTGGGTTLAALQSQLAGAGVEVLASACGHDGLAWPAVCGAPDGRIGVFAIPAAQDAAARALGFAPFGGAALKIPCQ